MAFISPMLASPIPKKWEFEPNVWAAEEKIDGIRIIAEVEGGSTDLFMNKKVTTWSRYGIIHRLPTHIIEDLCKLPNGIYDGEVYAPGKRSYGAVELKNQSELILGLFDAPEMGDTSFKLGLYAYDVRRHTLEKHVGNLKAVQLIPSIPVNTWEEVVELRDQVWARDGEGLILKRRTAPYQVGKRSKDFIKIKALRSAVLTVIGFQPSRGQINDRGPFATAILRDEEGNTTTVKTRNDALCRELEGQAQPGQIHPAIGRKLVIEFQERTPDGNYRHPRWDRWEDE